MIIGNGFVPSGSPAVGRGIQRSVQYSLGVGFGKEGLQLNLVSAGTTNKTLGKENLGHSTYGARLPGASG